MPQQKPGKSKQDYCTPPDFLVALKQRLGITEFDMDLAASADNTVATVYYDEAKNSLVQPWIVSDGWNFCNPPFKHIEPWVRKAWIETQINSAKTAMLLPASVGSNWWLNWVNLLAYATFLNGRITFVG